MYLRQTNFLATVRVDSRITSDRWIIGAKILTHRTYQGELWFQIQTPAPDACGELPPDVRPAIGWIPAYDSAGEPYIWFPSMGC